MQITCFHHIHLPNHLLSPPPLVLFFPHRPLQTLVSLFYRSPRGRKLCAFMKLLHFNVFLKVALYKLCLSMVFQNVIELI